MSEAYRDWLDRQIEPGIDGAYQSGQRDMAIMLRDRFRQCAHACREAGRLNLSEVFDIITDEIEQIARIERAL